MIPNTPHESVLVPIRMPQAMRRAVQTCCRIEGSNESEFIRKAVAFITYDKIVESDPAMEREPFRSDHERALTELVKWGETRMEAIKAKLTHVQSLPAGVK